MIAFEIDFKVLWDFDPARELNYQNAVKYFGQEMAKDHFYLLSEQRQHKRILQDLFHSADINLITAKLNLPEETSFEKKLAALFFCGNKTKIIEQFSKKAYDNFNSVFRMMGF